MSTSYETSYSGVVIQINGGDTLPSNGLEPRELWLQQYHSPEYTELTVGGDDKGQHPVVVSRALNVGLSENTGVYLQTYNPLNKPEVTQYLGPIKIDCKNNEISPTESGAPVTLKDVNVSGGYITGAIMNNCALTTTAPVNVSNFTCTDAARLQGSIVLTRGKNYGTEQDRDNIKNPINGQLFFVIR